MQQLKERILREGRVLPGNIIKVDGFLNHRVDTALMRDLADEFAKYFDVKNITMVLTAEASGIALATICAERYGVPMVFAKKAKSDNIEGGLYQSDIFSYTYKKKVTLLVSQDWITKDDKVLIIDDFMAKGYAMRGLIDIVNKAGAQLAGIAAAAYENGNADYIATAKRWWDDMAGKKLFVTGGVGAVHFDEKFGHDYYLPTDAYLETCAAVGVGFFSQAMNQLTGDAKYMDEFERALYNNVLAGVAASGRQYTYQNPLNTDRSERWEWHPCPCCPPMFLKIVSATPEFIYARDDRTVYVNLFIGSDADIALGDMQVHVRQQTRYPVDGKVVLTLTPEKAARFTVKVRIPGWARGEENPFGLYVSESPAAPVLSVNGTPVEIRLDKGYALLDRVWNPADRIVLELPVAPRLVRAHKAARELDGMATIAAGPLVYCIEQADNADYARLRLDTAGSMELGYRSDLMDGTPVITGTAIDGKGAKSTFTAIPYYAFGNRGNGGYRVWLPTR